jgi:hypothetical protein
MSELSKTGSSENKGSLGCGGTFLIFGLLVGMITVILYLPLLNYQTGQCTITAKQLISVQTEYTPPDNPSGGVGNIPSMPIPITSYKPDFQYSVRTANGRQYQAEGYDFRSSSTYQFTAQAVLDRYAVGKTYPCWYDPADPSHAILEYFYPWDLIVRECAIALIPIVLVVIAFAFFFLRRG